MTPQPQTHQHRQQTNLDWQQDASCHAIDTDLFYAEGNNAAAVSRMAKRVCENCLVRQECLDHAIAWNEPGVWGGTTYRERRDLRKRAGKAAARPSVHVNHLHERIAELTRKGYGAEEISALCNVTTRTVQRARTKLGVGPAKPPPLDSGELRRAANLLADGVSYGDAARMIGRSYEGVRSNLPHQSRWEQGGRCNGHE